MEAWIMSIRLLPQDNGSFGPGEVALLVDAFENAISDMGIDRDAPAALAVAKRIIEAAKQGERDPSRLCDEGARVVGPPSGTERHPPI
jgi:hypothetical protein